VEFAFFALRVQRGVFTGHDLQPLFGRFRFGLLDLRKVSQSEHGLAQQPLFIAVGVKAIVTDAIEVAGHYVLEVTFDKFLGLEGLFFRLAGVTVVPGKDDFFVCDFGEAVITECYPMGVASQVVDNVLGPRDGRLEVDDPWLFCSLVC
jgi:hypothetical protein